MCAGTWPLCAGHVNNLLPGRSRGVEGGSSYQSRRSLPLAAHEWTQKKSTKGRGKFTKENQGKKPQANRVKNEKMPRRLSNVKCSRAIGKGLHATQWQREGGGRGPCRHCAKWPQNGMEIRLYQYFMCYRLLRLLPSLIMTLVSPHSSISPLRSSALYQFVQAICANLARPARIYVDVCLRPIQSRIAYHTWRKLSGLIVKKYLNITEKVLIVH